MYIYVDISVVEDVDKLLILGWGWHGSVCPNYWVSPFCASWAWLISGPKAHFGWSGWDLHQQHQPPTVSVARLRFRLRFRFLLSDLVSPGILWQIPWDVPRRCASWLKTLKVMTVMIDSDEIRWLWWRWYLLMSLSSSSPGLQTLAKVDVMAERVRQDGNLWCTSHNTHSLGVWACLGQMCMAEAYQPGLQGWDSAANSGIQRTPHIWIPGRLRERE